MNAPSFDTADWRKSSYSGRNTDCVEVAGTAAGAAIRDTKHRDLGALSFPGPEWRAFLSTARDDQP
ncbi:DUF397 domain-containing protein [Nocardiopsis sp. ARC36]